MKVAILLMFQRVIVNKCLQLLITFAKKIWLLVKMCVHL